LSHKPRSLLLGYPHSLLAPVHRHRALDPWFLVVHSQVRKEEVRRQGKERAVTEWGMGLLWVSHEVSHEEVEGHPKERAATGWVMGLLWVSRVQLPAQILS
jgi:hypothetical protein